MPFDWKAYAELAESLWGHADFNAEARLRTAASRFYYAAHWRVRLHLESAHTQSFGSMDVHRAVVDACRCSHSSRLRVIGEKLFRLKGKRQHADYEARLEFVDIDLATARRSYSDICSALQALASGRQD